MFPCGCLVQECRQAALDQLSLLSQQRIADTEDKDYLEHVEGQWNAALGDATAVIQSKEADLKLVTDCARQTEAAKTTLEKLVAELDAIRK